MSNVEDDIKQLRRAIDVIFYDIEADEHAENEEEIAEEVEEELKREFAHSPKMPKLGQKLPVPGPEAIVSYDSNGNVLSRVGYDEWKIEHRGKLLSHNFRHQSDAIGLDLTGNVADHLVRFSQNCGSFMLPDNDPFSSVKSPNTSVRNLTYFRTLPALLMEKGFLLNLANVAPKPLSMITKAELKAELLQRMKDNRPSYHVSGLYRAIAKWVHLSSYVDLPVEFLPGFSIKDWQGDKELLKMVSRYEAERTTPWRDIPHDDLVRLLQESQVYVQDFGDDILFMYKKIHVELVDYMDEHTNMGAFETGATKPIFDVLMNHKFADDPRTGKPWFVPEVTKYESQTRRVLKPGQFNKEESRLLDCCVFLLLLWTAMRVEELLHCKVDGLFINGRRVRAEDDAIDAFKLAKGPNGTTRPKFELEFRTFKTTKDKKGRLRKIPIADDAAHAFCILIEYFRVNRNVNGNTFLLPAGGTKASSICHNKKGPANRSFITERLAKLCERTGVEYHHPHRCRKTLATIMINKNPDSLELIQRLLGHNTPKMTLRYLMTIPSIAGPVRQHLIASNRKRILDLVTAVASRRISGKAGERMLGAMPVEKLSAEVLPGTIKEITDMLISDPDFVVIKTHAAWCLRFRSLRPQQLPCLPNINLINIPPEDLAPDPSKCQPWQCGYAAHTSGHLRHARVNRDASKKLAGSAGVRAEFVQSFSIQAEYWENVVRHLELGHEGYIEVIPAEVFSSQVH